MKNKQQIKTYFKNKEKNMTKEEETGKEGGANDNWINEACGSCSGCCGIPVVKNWIQWINDKVDPTEEKNPP